MVMYIMYIIMYCNYRYRKEVERNTRGQSNNSEWMRSRKGKITASMIGQIYSMRSSTTPTSLLNTINQTSNNDLSHLPAIQHGKNFEQQAKEFYERKHQVSIEERGFMLHPKYSWLGASTDGYIVDPPSVVEIKCPMFQSKEDSVNLLSLAQKREKSQWFLKRVGGRLRLNSSHKYYYQCQIQMECLEVDRCAFIAYLCDDDGKYIDSYTEVISKDTSLVSKLLQKAYSFHTKYLAK